MRVKFLNSVKCQSEMESVREVLRYAETGITTCNIALTISASRTRWYAKYDPISGTCRIGVAMKKSYPTSLYNLWRCTERTRKAYPNVVLETWQDGLIFVAADILKLMKLYEKREKGQRYSYRSELFALNTLNKWRLQSGRTPLEFVACDLPPQLSEYQFQKTYDSIWDTI